jgi:hypothetical protein
MTGAARSTIGGAAAGEVAIAVTSSNGQAVPPRAIEASTRTPDPRDPSPGEWQLRLHRAGEAATRALATLRIWYFPPRHEFPYGFESPRTYLRKFRAPILRTRPGTCAVALWSCLGMLVALLLLALIDAFATAPAGWHVLLAFNGATAVLLFNTPESHASQPWNMIVGQQIAAITAVVITSIFGDAVVWLQGPLAVAAATLLMHATGSVNPPGGALALFYVTSPAVRANGWQILVSALIGSALQVAVAMLLLNAVRHHRYPEHYF